MKQALRFAENVLEQEGEDEFVIELGQDDATLDLIVAAFTDLGCIVERDANRPGRLTVRHSRG